MFARKFTALIAAALSIVTAAAAQEETAMLPEPTQSGYAPVNGVEIYYAVYGEGEPLVLLHGGLGMIEMFGPVIGQLAETRQVIGVDLQAHGRTLPFERPMSYPALATDIAELIRYLGHGKADVMGYSFGGSVALRTAIDHPDVVDRLIVVSAPFAFSGWHDYNREGMQAMGAHLAEEIKQSPMYEAYAQIAPDPENWPRLLEQMGEIIGVDYDWEADIPGITAPTLIAVADYDSVRISHATRFFELLGGGQSDAYWDGSGMTPNQFAVLPGTTHYNVFMDTRMGDIVLRFLDTRSNGAQ